MTHDGIIHCGGVGQEIGVKTIQIHDHTALNVAVHLKHRDETPAEFEKKKKNLAKLVHRMYLIAQEPGDEVHYYPHE